MLIATDSLSLVFIMSFLFGLLFLIVTAFMGNLGHHAHGIGHHMHAGGHGGSPHTALHGTHTAHGYHNTAKGGQIGRAINPLAWLGHINPISLAIFLTGFGFFGYVFHNTTALALPLAILLAGLSGLIIAGTLLVMINRIFDNSEGSTVQDVSDRTGLLGKVSITIQENSLGEIIYVSPGGMRKSIPARSIDGRRIERDQEVVVVSNQHGVAEVDTWDHVIHQEELNSPNEASTDELANLRTLLEESHHIRSDYVMRKDLLKE